MKQPRTAKQASFKIAANASRERHRPSLGRAAWITAACVTAIVFAVASPVLAIPVFGEVRTLPQPDGTLIDVRIWGDEYYGVTESLDGYTLVRDPVSLFFCYAALSSDGNDLLSTGVPLAKTPPPALALAPHIRIKPDAAHAKAETARRQWSDRGKSILGGRTPGRSPTTGNVAGICLIVDFADDVGTITPLTVSNYCNQVGFNLWGNNGSIRDYFYSVSDGLLTYTNYVPAAYYRALHPKTYYTNPAIPYGYRARELILEALNYLEAQGFDFSQYDADHDGIVDALNCFYAGNCPNNWAEGLWPHAWTVSFTADGVSTESYQISNMGGSLYLSTFCHENGHMLMGWPDLYDYDGDSRGVGRFCIMCYGTSSTNPCEPCAYLKYAAGWSNTTVLTTPRIDIVVPSTSNVSFKYDRPFAPNEFYMIENRQQAGRDSGLPDAGLAIWHIDTNGNNSNQQMTPTLHYLVTLVQADGRWDLEHNANYGDSTDLWAAPTHTQCTPTTTPNTNWWSGTSSSLSITHISASGANMTFWFNAADCTTPGDVNQDGKVDGRDISGFVCTKLTGSAGTGENPACAKYGGTPEEDIAAFVSDLLGV